ncbi:hypothetical protein N9L11_02415, partial [Euryarchaeota archaeon]|nr:hypothetical protein [Euryarchaeota archaeon]
CQRSIGWADYIEMEKFKHGLKRYMDNEFEEWSVERAELFFEGFFNDIDAVANNLHCDVAQLRQAFIHLSRNNEYQGLFAKLCENVNACKKKKIKNVGKYETTYSSEKQIVHVDACVLSGSGMKMLFKKLGITNAVGCRELGPIYLSRVSLVKEKGWKIKSILCDDVFLARNTRVDSKEDEFPLTRYQRSPAESHR